MIHNSSEILLGLINMTHTHLSYAKQLLEVPEEELQHKQSNASWSALECIEHLNRYTAFYNKEIKQKMNASSLAATPIFKSSYLGQKFSNDMLPKEGMKTMNTFKSKNPNKSSLSKETVLLTFIQLLEAMLTNLKIGQTKNLDKIKTKTTLPILKFKLGDTFRFVIHHNERHIVQAKKAIPAFS